MTVHKRVKSNTSAQNNKGRERKTVKQRISNFEDIVPERFKDSKITAEEDAIA